jgi:FkbM family methyltransferase
MQGSKACLKWNLEDLVSLDIAMSLTKGRKLAVQAGGNLGLFPKRMAEEFACVYTFEPDLALMSCLRHNAREPNIKAIQAALGDSDTPVRLECGRRDNSGRAVHEGLTYVAGAGDVPQVRLDDMDLPACDLIYLDIEGYEMHALLGAQRTVERFHPVLALEINGNVLMYNTTKAEIRGWITARGYRLVTRHRGDDIYV